MGATTVNPTASGRRARLRVLAAATTAAAIALVTLAACGTGHPDAVATPESGTAPAEAAATTGAIAAAPVVVKDPWVKASDSGMTAVFGSLVNTTGTELVVVSATTPAARKAELHEVVDVEGKPVMRPKPGGFVIPAQGVHQLRPGADHVMLMGLTGAVKPGDEIVVSLTLGDGRTLRFTAVAKAFAGGKENYNPGMKKG